MNRENRAASLAHRLVREASISDTPGEAAFAEILHREIVDGMAVAGVVATTKLVPSHGDPLASSVAVLVRGTGRRCVVLAGHYDVVATENYGKLRDLAFDPDALHKALVAGLEQDGQQNLALEDLRSGAFIPGRGMLDMKSGLAAGIAVLEQFGADTGRTGNILFVATPDEENKSRGMRSLRDALPALAAEWDLEFIGGINLDATDDYGDGSVGRSMYFGSVGKYSPFAYIVGVPTHAGYPFEGFSAHLIGAEIIRAIEYNTDLADTAHGETAPPPMCLEARDFRESYDVTTPDRSWISFNWLSHSRTPDELFTLFREQVEGALARALAYRRTRATSMTENTGVPREGRVVSVSELMEKLAASDNAAMQRFVDYATTLADEGSPLVVSQRLTRYLVDATGLEGPAVVIGFASLFYPPVHVEAARFRKLVEDAAQSAAGRHGTTIVSREFFPGISDMSFLGQRRDPFLAKTLVENTVAQDNRDSGGVDAPAFPVVNIGPWGRDCHKKHERVHAPYAFDVLPDIVADVVAAILRD